MPPRAPSADAERALPEPPLGRGQVRLALVGQQPSEDGSDWNVLGSTRAGQEIFYDRNRTAEDGRHYRVGDDRFAELAEIDQKSESPDLLMAEPDRTYQL